jgi:hypothetical protein
VLWPGWTQVVEEHPAAVLVGVKKDRGAALRTTRIRIDETAADGARQVALEKADGIALMHVFKKLRPIGPGPAALIDAPPAPAIRIVVEAGHPKPRTSSEVARSLPATPGTPEDWPAAWASDTIVVAHDAFAGAQFKQTSPQHWSVTFADHNAYENAEDSTKRQQLAKAGARLAELLNAIWP